MNYIKRSLPLLALLLILLLTACAPAGGEDSVPPVDAEQTPPGVETLVYATVIQTNVLRDKVDQFNRSHTDVQIVVKEYAGATYQENLQAREQFLTELAAGQVPDIIGGSVPYHTLARKGYLEDLWPYIESDPNLGRENVMEAPLRAAEVDGGLYVAFSSVDVCTLSGAAGVVGDRTSWTLDDLKAVLAAMPEDSSILEYGATRSSAESLLSMSLEQYVDWETGQCRFDSEDFRSALEFLKSFPEDAPSDVDSNAYAGLTREQIIAREQARWAQNESRRQTAREEADARQMSGRQMLEAARIQHIGNIQELDLRWGGRCAFVGYPVEDGSVGSFFDPSRDITAISSACKNKEAAWEFLRSVLMREPDQLEGGIPIYRVFYDASKRFYMSHPREVILYDSQPLASTVKAPPLTEEQARRFEDFFNSIDKLRTDNDTLEDLVMEICGPYFAGDKTLDETVQQLQNRVSLYVNESR